MTCSKPKSPIVEGLLFSNSENEIDMFNFTKDFISSSVPSFFQILWNLTIYVTQLMIVSTMIDFDSCQNERRERSQNLFVSTLSKLEDFLFFNGQSIMFASHPHLVWSHYPSVLLTIFYSQVYDGPDHFHNFKVKSKVKLTKYLVASAHC